MGWSCIHLDSTLIRSVDLVILCILCCAHCIRCHDLLALAEQKCDIGAEMLKICPVRIDAIQTFLSNLIERSMQRTTEVKIIDVCKTRNQMIFVGYISWFVHASKMQLLDYHCQSHTHNFDSLLLIRLIVSCLELVNLGTIGFFSSFFFHQFVHDAIRVPHINNQDLCIGHVSVYSWSQTNEKATNKQTKKSKSHSLHGFECVRERTGARTKAVFF